MKEISKKELVQEPEVVIEERKHEAEQFNAWRTTRDIVVTLICALATLVGIRNITSSGYTMDVQYGDASINMAPPTPGQHSLPDSKVS